MGTWNLDRGCLAAILVLEMASQGAGAQTAGQAPALAPVAPAAPDPGRPGQVVVLPGGGTGVVMGGTPYFQSVQTPGGGTAIIIPNGNGTSTIIGPNGQSGTVKTP